MTTLSVNYPSGYVLHSDSDRLTIDRDVLVAGLSVLSKNNFIDNFGLVVGAEGVGLENPQQDGTLVNELGAVIIGTTFAGIDIAGGVDDTIRNLGIVEGAIDGVSMNSANSQLRNFGSVAGQSRGVVIVGGGEIITNFGAIRSLDLGIFVDTGGRGPTQITNRPTGIIDGGDEAIQTGNNAAIVLDNHGTIVGGVDCEVAGAHDRIVNRGTIHGKVFLSDGDVFDGTGGRSGEIFASGGGDRIIAGKGNVSILSAVGNDRLTAGPGHDRFIFNFVPTVGGPVDKITNFVVRHDQIDLVHLDFAALPIGPLAAANFHTGAHAKTGSQQIIYNPNTGFLFYDPDGSGPGPQFHFANLSPHLALNHADFVVTA